MRNITLLALLSFVCVATMPGATVVAVQSGGIVIGATNTATAGTQAAPWTIVETMTALGTLRMSDTDGTPLQSPSTIAPFVSGNWFTKTVTNNTGGAWSSFELELQEILGTPSSDGSSASLRGQG